MTSKYFTTSSMVLVLLLTMGCLSSSIATPVSKQIQIVPISLTKAPSAEAGWQDIIIGIVFVNSSGNFLSGEIWNLLSPGSDSVTLTTAEGYSYNLSPQGYVVEDEFPIGLKNAIFTLPPGFIFRGFADIDMSKHSLFSVIYELRGRIAQNATPQALNIAGFSTIPLENISSPVFPGGENYPLKHVGDSIEIADRFALTIISFTKNTYQEYDNASIVTATLRFENLNKGYQEELNIESYLIGDDGITSLRLGCPEPKLSAGPLQTIQTQVCFLVDENTQNLRMVIFGDVNDVFDTGY